MPFYLCFDPLHAQGRVKKNKAANFKFTKLPFKNSLKRIKRLLFCTESNFLHLRVDLHMN